MAKKAELLEQAKSLKLEVSTKNTIVEIEAAIAKASPKEVPAEEKPAKETVAKAGKRSEKGIKEAEEKQEKIEHQKNREETTEAEVAKPKQPIKPTRPKHERKGKKYKEAYAKIDQTKSYPLKEAISLAQTTSTTKFDASVELHVNLNVNPKHADQNIRGNIVLPNGTGKKVTIAVFDDAKTEGADIVGIEKISKALEAGEIKFDILISSPANMAKLGKYARLLGPRGLMPNPKSGTVTTDIAKAVKEAKAGKVDYRVDSTGIVHVAVGKVSFDTAKLVENCEALLASINSAKPNSVKGNYITSIHVTSSMGPSVAVKI